MHEETRRRLLRAAFQVLCVVPTLGIVAWALVCTSPLPVRKLERQLDRELGMLVGVGQLSHPRPSQLRLRGVRLLDRETLQPRFTIPHLLATKNRGGWRANFSDASVQAHSLPALWNSLQQCLVRRHVALSWPVDGAICRRLTIELPSGPLTLHNVVWSIITTTPNHESRVAFSLDENASEAQVRLQITRDRSASHPATTATLDTGPHRLPLSLLLAVAGYDTNLTASFQGRLTVTGQPHGHVTQCEGNLRGVPLELLSANWITSDTPIAGNVDVDDIIAEISSNGLSQAHGIVTGDQIRVAERLIRDLSDAKLLGPKPVFAPGSAYPLAPDSDGSLLINTLSLEIGISAMGLACRGVVSHAHPNAAAIDEQERPMLLSDGHIRTSRLISVLVPKDSANSRDIAARLMRVLPPTLPVLR